MGKRFTQQHRNREIQRNGVSFAGVVGEIRASVIDVWKIPGTGPQVIRSLLQDVHASCETNDISGSP